MCLQWINRNGCSAALDVSMVRKLGTLSHRASTSIRIAVVTAILLSGLAFTTSTASAFGLDGGDPTTCSGPITLGAAGAVNDANGSLVGIVQRRYSGCGYGSIWARTCVKLWYTGVGTTTRETSTQPGFYLSLGYASNMPPGSCSSGWAGQGYSHLVFYNCTLGGMNPCTFYGSGPVYQSGVLVGVGGLSILVN